MKLLRCSRCKQEKPEDSFHTNKSKKCAYRNHRASECKECVSYRKREFTRKKREIELCYKVLTRERSQLQKEEDTYFAMLKQEKCRLDQDERNRIAKRVYREKTKERTAIYAKQWAEKNKDKLKERRRKYIEENRNKWREIRRKYKNKRLQEDPVFALRCRMRSSFNLWRKEKIRSKKATLHFIELVGLSPTAFNDYIVSLFKEGMCWDNIHIDHYVPLAHFDFEKQDDIRIAWYYKNLRPLLVVDNLKKGDSLPDDYERHINMIKSELGIHTAPTCSIL